MNLQKRYLYLNFQDEYLYYSHSEFDPNTSKKYTEIPLNSSVKFHSPSQIIDNVEVNQLSIDLLVEDRTYSFVSDSQFPNSRNIIQMVKMQLVKGDWCVGHCYFGREWEVWCLPFRRGSWFFVCFIFIFILFLLKTPTSSSYDYYLYDLDWWKW